jgi:hypothetical protein
MSGDKLSGISRAIAVAGNQAALSRLIWERCRVHLWQSRLSEYERSGYAPLRSARLISEATGVPVEDLLRPANQRAHRRVARSKEGIPYGRSGN